jgi:hypothetical protein
VLPDTLPSLPEQTTCTRQDCPGLGEALFRCGNPDHWALFDSHADGALPPRTRKDKIAALAATGDYNANEAANAQAKLDTLTFEENAKPEVAGSYYFHRQRSASPDGSGGFHGQTRRGKPRDTFCSNDCSVWYGDHIAFVDEHGRVFRKRKVWSRVQDTFAMDGHPNRALPDYTRIEHAINGLRVLIGKGAIPPRGKRTAVWERVAKDLLTPRIEVIHNDASLDEPLRASPDGEPSTLLKMIGDAAMVAPPSEDNPAEAEFFEWLGQAGSGIKREIARLRFLVVRHVARSGATYGLALRHTHPEVMAEWLAVTESRDVADAYLAERRRQADVAKAAEVQIGYVITERTDPWDADPRITPTVELDPPHRRRKHDQPSRETHRR